MNTMTDARSGTARALARRGVGAVAAAGVLLTVGMSTASAHVTVKSPDAKQGGKYQLITVKVPTESDTASTTDVKLSLPTETPLIGISVQQQAGWTITTTTSKLPKPVTMGDDQITESVTEIEWKAGNGGIPPNQFAQFVFSVAQLPDAPKVVFKAVQTYSDGKVVKWIEEPAAGSTEAPEHPAPSLALAAASTGDGHDHSATATPVAQASSDDSDSDSSTIGGIALGVGIVALLLAVVGLAVALRAKGNETGASSA